ncbi:hypothetical protein MTO96_031410 [Rhipicephalus appendiculatus]
MTQGSPQKRKRTSPSASLSNEQPEHSKEGPANSSDSDDRNDEESELTNDLDPVETHLTAESASTFSAIRTGMVYAKRSMKTQTPFRLYPSIYFVNRKRRREKERALKAKNERLSRTVDSYKQELLKLKEAGHVSAFIEITSDAENGNPKARLIVDQRSVQELMSLPVLSCGNTDSDHRKALLELITRKLIKPLFANYAQGETDTNSSVKFLQKKPLSRKILKL